MRVAAGTQDAFRKTENGKKNEREAKTKRVRVAGTQDAHSQELTRKRNEWDARREAAALDVSTAARNAETEAWIARAQQPPPPPPKGASVASSPMLLPIKAPAAAASPMPLPGQQLSGGATPSTDDDTAAWIARVNAVQQSEWEEHYHKQACYPDPRANTTFLLEQQRRKAILSNRLPIMMINLRAKSLSLDVYLACVEAKKAAAALKRRQEGGEDSEYLPSRPAKKQKKGEAARAAQIEEEPGKSRRHSARVARRQ